MSLDLPHTPRPERVAIIGGGISGLACAHLLSPDYAVTLYEAADRLGGHARTVMAGVNGDQPVDTGFIVFNYANYPHLTRLFRDLAVPVIKSDMSFGASIDGGRIEYGLRDLATLTAQKRNLLRPGFARMLRDIMRFNAEAEALAQDDSATIGELMDAMRLGRWFQDYYLTPLSGAIWSTPAEEIRGFPAKALIQFFRNHALMGVQGQHQWWTVDGGSVEYLRRLDWSLRGRGVALHIGTPVRAVLRDGAGGVVQLGGRLAGRAERFDHVIFACHADQALGLIDRPTGAEQAALSAQRFQDNEMVLHRDPGQMPKRRKVWSSWVYQADSRAPQQRIAVSYWMNRLQKIPDTDPLFVTLNPTTAVRDALIYDQTTFRHPVFDADALAAQGLLRALQGVHNTWFAGAWTRHGFHEDGFASAVRIARALKAQTARVRAA